MTRYVKRGKVWQYEISTKDEEGKYKKIRKSGFLTKKSAIRGASEVEAKIRDGYKDVRDKVLAVYFEDWIKAFKHDKVAPGTYLKYQYTLQILQQYFGQSTIQSLTRQNYQVILNRFALSHATATVRQINMHVRSSLSNLIDDGLLHLDFTKGAVTIGQKPTKKENEKYLNYSEFKALIDLARKSINPRFNSALMIYIGAKTGMRFGELLALTWEAIRFDKNLIEVTRTWDYHNQSGFRPTKSSQSVRNVAVDQETMKILKKAQIEQKHLFEKLRIQTEQAFIFYNSRDGLLSNNAPNKLLRKFCQQIGAHPITMHGLRHTHASVLLYKRVSMILVSKRLGHASINITQGTYSHVLKELEEEETENIKQIMSEL